MLKNKFEMRILLNRVLRGRLLSFYGAVSGHITETLNGRKISYKTTTEIGRSLFYNGSFEKSELKLCANYIDRNSIVLDIGANIGLHSLFFSDLATEGVVFSFEPALETFEFLVRNVKCQKNIIPLDIAIADASGITEFYIAADDAYSSLKDTKRHPIKKLQKAVSYKLDDIFSCLNLEHIDFVKIDVEGFEHHVLRGMQRLIERYRPVIFCEIYKGKNSNESPEATIDFLSGFDYDVFVMAGDELARYTQHVDSIYNYLFLPRKQ